LKLYAAARIQLAASGRRVKYRIVENTFAAAFLTGILEWHPARSGSGPGPGSWDPYKIGPAGVPLQKNQQKMAFFRAIPFTSFRHSLMIEIELRRAYPRATRCDCSTMTWRGWCAVLPEIDA
jgi:hypothetical protein